MLIKSQRVMKALLEMHKLDIQTLIQAYEKHRINSGL